MGFERAGMVCKWQVEIDEYCNRVLEKHWPDVRRWGDVRTFPPALGEYGSSAGDNDWNVDVICGGFPCQDISVAGKGAGINGSRSGLWSEYKRIICELRPRIVVVENVAALLVRGIDRVLGDLAASGYAAEWGVLSACGMGYTHTRERVFILAYPESERWCKRRIVESQRKQREPERCDQGTDWGKWPFSPDDVRTAHGVPDRMGRISGSGNAVLPDISEWIGRRIIEAEKEHATNRRTETAEQV